jgi:hypothetical protein
MIVIWAAALFVVSTALVATTLTGFGCGIAPGAK